MGFQCSTSLASPTDQTNVVLLPAVNPILSQKLLLKCLCCLNYDTFSRNIKKPNKDNKTLKKTVKKRLKQKNVGKCKSNLNCKDTSLKISKEVAMLAVQQNHIDNRKVQGTVQVISSSKKQDSGDSNFNLESEAFDLDCLINHGCKNE